MLIDKVHKLPVWDRLLYWIREREAIRLRREGGKPRPWTDDAILRQYRFCNVRRMDDKVSRWLLEKWYTPNKGSPNMFLACVIARHFNLPTTLAVLGFPKLWQPEKVRASCKLLKEKGWNVFNNAYIISGGTGAKPNGPRRDKIDIVIDKVIQPIIDSGYTPDTNSMQQSVEGMLGFAGIGSFMAGQIIADMRWAAPGRWLDKCDWAPQGPGSTRGLCRLYEMDVDRHGLKADDFLQGLREVIAYCKRRLPPGISERLEAIDYQSCLCEYDKFSRAIEGDGKPKQKYAGV